MGKRIRKITYVFLIVALFTALNTKVSYAERKQLNIEQAVGNPPEITAYVNGEKVSKDAEYTASFKGKDIEFATKSVTKFAKADKPLRYVIFLDNSKSVDEKQFNEVKKSLVNLRKKIRKIDKMELYTVGADSKHGNKVEVFKADGKSDKKSRDKDIKKINKIKRNKNYTVLYRSITKKLTTVDNSSERTVMFLITDGEDDSAGKDKEDYNVNPAVKKSKVPVYAVLLKNVSSKPNLSKIKNTKKNILNENYSRGYYKDCSSTKDVKKGFKEINRILFDETYVLNFRAADGSNKTLSLSESKLNIVMKSGGKTKEAALDKEGQFEYTNSQKDTDRPKVKSIEQSGDNSIKVKIEDGTTKKLTGAQDKSNYLVRFKGKDGKVWEISNITVNEQEHTYTLFFKDKFYTGSYTLECKNIKDDSVEKNTIKTDKVKFEVKDGLNLTAEGIKQTVRAYWWILVVLIVIVIGVITIIVVKKKPANVVEVPADDLMKADSKLIRLIITDRAGKIREVEWNVEGSIFVGRSNICNIYFDDDRLSRQHFAIEVTKMACYIEDLETTNSTFVNGVKITGKRMLLDGDVITAGREKFEFHSVENGGDEQVG